MIRRWTCSVGSQLTTSAAAKCRGSTTAELHVWQALRHVIEVSAGAALMRCAAFKKSQLVVSGRR